MTLNWNLPCQSVLHHIRSKHLLWSRECFLELCVSLLLDRLSVLELLDKFHLEHLHLHDFLLFHSSYSRLIVKFTIDIAMNRMNTTLLILFNLQLSKTFLLYDDLILKLVVLLGLHIYRLSALLQLRLHCLRLLCFLALRQVYGLLDLPLLILSLLLDHVIRLRVHLLRLNIHLQINDFLYTH